MKNKLSEAQLDAIVNGQAFGGVAERLLANGFNVNSLRQNATTLRHEEWQFYDKAVVEIARPTLVGVNDLRAAGLVFNLDGMANTVLMWETISDTEDALLGMDPGLEVKNDRQEFVPNYLPLVITSKSFKIGVRELNASRKGTQSLDATLAQNAAFKVADKIEEVLFRGASTYKFGDGILYGYCDHPNRNLVTLGTHWDASAATGATIVAQVLDMVQAAINDNCYGPYGLYVPPAYASVIADDYKTYSSVTIAQRIQEIQNMQFVKVAPKLAANNVVLVQLSKNTVEMIIGMDVTNVPWDSPGGFYLNHKVMAIMVPRIKADQDGRCGIVHCS
jgi:uncharacterized linocin/CFP29 family protein